MFMDVDYQLRANMFAMYNCFVYDTIFLLLYAMLDTVVSENTKSKLTKGGHRFID